MFSITPITQVSRHRLKHQAKRHAKQSRKKQRKNMGHRNNYAYTKGKSWDERHPTLKPLTIQTANTAYYYPQLYNKFDLIYFQFFLWYKYFDYNYSLFLFH